MRKDILSALYGHYKDSEQEPDSPGAVKALDTLYDHLEETSGAPRELYESQTLAIAAAYDEQGWRRGFKYGVQIMRACSGQKKESPDWFPAALKMAQELEQLSEDECEWRMREFLRDSEGLPWIQYFIKVVFRIAEMRRADC
ncbi:MAG: hypothetical protein LUG62_10095 [Clostridiales bacterium]|nr:hypothetical protein [Clostridiales bacterium]